MQMCQVVQDGLLKNVANSSFHLVTYNNWTIKVCILSRYISVVTNLTKVVLFAVGLSSKRKR